MTMTQERHAGTVGTLNGRVALVTGGTAGIGAAISRQLSGEGATVGAGYWRHQERAAQFRGDMAERYPDRLFTVHEGNIGSAGDCRRVVAEVIERSGRSVRPELVAALICTVDGAVVSALVDDRQDPRTVARSTVIDVIDAVAPFDRRPVHI